MQLSIPINSHNSYPSWEDIPDILQAAEYEKKGDKINLSPGLGASKKIEAIIPNCGKWLYCRTKSMDYGSGTWNDWEWIPKESETGKWALSCPLIEKGSLTFENIKKLKEAVSNWTNAVETLKIDDLAYRDRCHLQRWCLNQNFYVEIYRLQEDDYFPESSEGKDVIFDLALQKGIRDPFFGENVLYKGDVWRIIYYLAGAFAWSDCIRQSDWRQLIESIK